MRGIRRASVDAVVTSPPYLNAIDYLRGHKLALVWLGYATPKIRNIKSLGVGAAAQHQRRASNRLNEIVRIASVGELPPGIERVVKRYVYDMMACLKQTYRVLRPGGYAVYVVSNSMLRGVEVDTAKLIVEIASEAGLQLEESYVRDIPREHRYLPPPQATANPQLANANEDRIGSSLPERNPVRNLNSAHKRGLQRYLPAKSSQFGTLRPT